MTDTLTPGSEWLLPVTYLHNAGHNQTIRQAAGWFWVEPFASVEVQELSRLIPASRLADLEAEVARLNKALVYEEDLTSRIGTHGPGCYMWGPNHYECLKAEFGRVADLYYDTRDELRDALNPKD